MSDGKTHYIYWKRVLPASLVCSVILMPLSVPFGISTGMGYLLGAVNEPDLDGIGLSSSEGRMMRKFGCLGVLWVMYWMPYAYLVPHRSPFSHWPYVGSAVRLVYMFILPILVVWWFGFQLRMIPQQYDNTILVCGLGLWNGLAWSDWVHFVLDTKWFKRLTR